MYGRSNMETYITICKIGSQQGNLLYGSGVCINLEAWGGEGEGREVRKRRDICMCMADSC